MSQIFININFTSQPPRMARTISINTEKLRKQKSAIYLMQHKEAAAELGTEHRPLPPILYTNHKIIKCHLFILSPHKNIFDHYFCFFSQRVIFF